MNECIKVLSHVLAIKQKITRSPVLPIFRNVCMFENPKEPILSLFLSQRSIIDVAPYPSKKTEAFGALQQFYYTITPPTFRSDGKIHHYSQPHTIWLFTLRPDYLFEYSKPTKATFSW